MYIPKQYNTLNLFQCGGLGASPFLTPWLPPIPTLLYPDALQFVNLDGRGPGVVVVHTSLNSLGIHLVVHHNDYAG